MTEETIFAEAREQKTPEELDAYLGRACGGDAALRARVVELLALDQNARSFLERPAAEQMTLSMAPGHAPPEAAGTTPNHSLDQAIGSRIGPYKILQRIGEGGMGVVYMADQEKPVRRRVALKIIKPGMDSAQVIARFEAERQALAMMDHPGIAHVYDAGTTESGRPYFAMELVQGVPITEYCDQKQLAPRERLALFVPVCKAIQHAHTKGIIHRDIKPSNILVTTCDGKPVPKVIDFGVAKALHQTLTERTMFTQFGGVIGTLQYMSPEQTELDVMGTDARCDIYSLGVLLYELLTGSTPLDARKIKEVGYAEMLRTIREQEPPRPSTRLSVAGQELTVLSARRSTEPRKLSRLVSGDLDWIVMKCLEKDRARRYETANGLARDLERYLSDEAVEACPPTAGYRLRKLAHKYRTPLRVGAVFALLLVAATVVSVYLAVQAKHAQFEARTDQNRAVSAEITARLAEEAAKEDRDKVIAAKAVAEQERDKAIAEKKRADEQAAITEEVNAFLNDAVLGQADVGQQAMSGAAPNRDLTLREALDNAAAHLRTTSRLEGTPRVLAAIRSTIGTVYKNLGEFDKAQEHLEAALVLSRQVAGEGSVDTIQALGNLAELYERQGQHAKAEPLAVQALEDSRKYLGEDNVQTFSSLTTLAEIYVSEKQFAKAEPLLTQALDGWRKTWGEENSGTINALHNLALLYTTMGLHAKAEPLLQQALQTSQKIRGAQHPDTLVSMEVLAEEYLNLRDYTRALPLLQQVVGQRRKILGPQHPDTVASIYWLSVLYQEQKQFDDAEPLRLEVVQWCTDHQGGDVGAGLTMSTILPRTIDLYSEWGKPDKVREYEAKMGMARIQKLEIEVRSITRRILERGDAHPDTANLYADRANRLERLGRFEESEADYAKEAALNPKTYWSQFRRQCQLAYLGKTSLHAELSARSLAAYGNSSDTGTADHAIKPWLMLPIAGDIKHVAELTDGMVQRASNNFGGGAWSRLTQAMARYRAADFDGCLDAAVKCREVGALEAPPANNATTGVTSRANSNAARANAALLLEAMAQWQLGHPTEARAALDQAVRQLDDDFPQAGKDDLDALGAAENWFVCQTLRREALGLISTATPTTVPESVK